MKKEALETFNMLRNPLPSKGRGCDNCVHFETSGKRSRKSSTTYHQNISGVCVECWKVEGCGSDTHWEWDRDYDNEPGSI